MCDFIFFLVIREVQESNQSERHTFLISIISKWYILELYSETLIRFVNNSGTS